MFSRRNVLPVCCGAAASLLAVRPMQAADALQNGSFKQDVIALLARRHPEWTVLPGDDLTTLRIASKDISLTNLYLHVQAMSAADREREIIAFFEHGMRTDAAKDASLFTAAEEYLRLQIMPDDYRKTASDLICRPFFAGLSIAYALDDNERYQLLRQSDVSAWAVGQQDIEARATANLETLSASVTLKPTPGAEAGAFIIVDTSDGYDAVRLLLPRFMARLRAALDVPSVFAGIPNRDFLVAWTPDFSARRGFAAKIADDVRRRPHPLTEALFVSADAGVRLANAAEMLDHAR
ncbi:DUF1444 family protein [Methylovirgula sp. 4M-Z18]|uniref:DUF1444 family protein n=1 Tax=Methylovirgula sp. 4M-Z18 TaxID=2293567 RepID=UPI000E362042|nr:DUF1444 family protein [Methylovirgula sp. 4M-Z18]RFB80491.1 DUF1444 family protein [Methylovirgula sp. 4M-Z18]